MSEKAIEEIVQYHVFVHDKNAKEIYQTVKSMGYVVDKRQLKELYQRFKEEKNDYMGLYLFQQSIVLPLHLLLLLGLFFFAAFSFQWLGVLFFFIACWSYLRFVFKNLYYVCEMMYAHEVHPSLFWQFQKRK